MTAQPGSDDDLDQFAAYLQDITCKAFDVKPWEIGMAPAPWHVRLLRPYRFIRYRYPNTAVAVLYTLAAVAMLFFGPVRKWGELALGLMAIAFIIVAGERLSRRR